MITSFRNDDYDFVNIKLSKAEVSKFFFLCVPLTYVYYGSVTYHNVQKKKNCSKCISCIHLQ